VNACDYTSDSRFPQPFSRKLFRNPCRGGARTTLILRQPAP
jgi:hypothetical protein